MKRLIVSTRTKGSPRHAARDDVLLTLSTQLVMEGYLIRVPVGCNAISWRDYNDFLGYQYSLLVFYSPDN